MVLLSSLLYHLPCAFLFFLCSLEMHKQLNPELAAAAAAAAAAGNPNHAAAAAAAAMAMPVSMATLQPALGGPVGTPVTAPLKFPMMSTAAAAQGQPIFDSLTAGQTQQPKALTTKLKGGQSTAMFVQAQTKKQNGAAAGSAAAAGGKFAPY